VTELVATACLIGVFFLLSIPIVFLIASCNNFVLLPLENVYNGHTDNELVIDTRPKEHCAHE